MAMYENEKESELHSRAIETLARDTGTTAEEVVPLYEMELVKLKETARINDFLTVLVSRRVRETLKRGEAIGT